MQTAKANACKEGILFILRFGLFWLWQSITPLQFHLDCVLNHIWHEELHYCVHQHANDAVLQESVDLACLTSPILKMWSF